MTDRAPGSLLPSIHELLKLAGAERKLAVNLYKVSWLPVFRTERWRKAIAEFLRWSGTTLDVAADASVYELILCYGREGALAVYNGFREYLLGSGTPPAESRARLEAVQTVVSMAAHWLHQIDWNLDGAGGIEPEDILAPGKGSWTLRLPAELSSRLKKAASSTPGLPSLSDFVEKTLAAKITELEASQGRPLPPGEAERKRLAVERKAPEPARRLSALDQEIENFWKKAAEERVKRGATPTFIPPPKPPEEQH